VAAVARYIADTSALSRLHHASVARTLGPLIEAGLVATCAMIEFEVLWATRSPVEFEVVRDDRRLGYEWLAPEDTDWRRALDVQGELWSTGHIRQIPLPDLLISAVAERNSVTVLHYDDDYDVIASVTGQPMSWVVERGTVP
jgi:predicted nucleic acid-binding protein